jgi:acetylornithine deacetylase/succinyl-diaminopimelate desuccinylase-like protein
MNRIVMIIFSTTFLLGQLITKDQIEKFAIDQDQKLFQEFYDFLSLPNDANIPDQLTANIEWCERSFKKRGFKIQSLKTDRLPLILAEKRFNRNYPTVLFYVQVDGQPVDPTKWFQKDPFLPVLKSMNSKGEWQEIPWDNLKKDYDEDWRVFARSASDAKAPINSFLIALDIMDEQNLEPNYNIKVIMDMEEEMGSPNLPNAVKKYRKKLKADRLVILDGPRHPSNEPTLTFGARGIATIQLKVHGPKYPQHSGHYGNYVPNPAIRLSQIIASMKNQDGVVTINGFYDGIEISDKARKIMAQVPDDENEIRRSIGISEIDKVADNYQESIQYPSLNVRGLKSGWVEKEVRTIIPSFALAEIDVRLVKETDPNRLIGLIKEHIQKQGYHIIKKDPSDVERMKYGRLITFKSKISYTAFRTPIDSPIGDWLSSAIRNGFEMEPIIKRTSGGSVPISPFVNTLGVPAVTVPTVNPDNNQHSPNENIRVGNLIESVRTHLAILAQPYK